MLLVDDRTAYGGDIRGIRPRVVGHVNDDRCISVVTSEKDRPGVESTIDESVNTGNIGHPDSNILVLLENSSSLESGSESGTVGERVFSIGRSVNGDDSIHHSLRDKEGLNRDVLVSETSIDEGDGVEFGDLFVS